MSTFEPRLQALMKVLRENNVTRQLSDTLHGGLVMVPFDDNSLRGLAMQLLFADAQARQAERKAISNTPREEAEIRADLAGELDRAETGADQDVRRARLVDDIEELLFQREGVTLLCELTMRYQPDSEATLGAQRLAMSVLDMLGVDWDRADYLARLAAARPAAGRTARVCREKWPSGEDNNPHECLRAYGHLARHMCGCGAKAT